jgi:hypothetical protein
VKQKQTQRQAIEIAYLINGGMVSVRRLSRRGEWRAGIAAFGIVAGLAAALSVVVGLVLFAAHRVVYGPAYLGLWAVIGLGAGALAAARAVRRARRYSVGSGIDDDAFAVAPLPLVRRAGEIYRLALDEGFTGRVESGRNAIPIEGLVRDGVKNIELHPDSRAELKIGTGTFVVRALPEAGPAPELPRGVIQRFVRRSLLPLEGAALASVLCAVPVGAHIGEADMRSAIPANATPWEIEKHLRWEAQLQARSLHQCFDVLPIACQRPGYVGVGLSLSRQGEIRSQWIAKSTFGVDCPVNECMSEVIGTWFFEPLPEPMRVIVPVQVLRTDRPLPYGAARAAADLERSQPRTSID